AAPFRRPSPFTLHPSRDLRHRLVAHARRHHQRCHLCAARARAAARLRGHARDLRAAGRVHLVCGAVDGDAAARTAAGHRLGADRRRAARRRPRRGEGRARRDAGAPAAHRRDVRRRAGRGERDRGLGGAAAALALAAGAGRPRVGGAARTDPVSHRVPAAGERFGARAVRRLDGGALRAHRARARVLRRRGPARQRVLRRKLQRRRAERRRAEHRRRRHQPRRHGGAVAVLRAHALRQGAARHRDQPGRRAPGRRAHRAVGKPELRARRVHRRALGHPHRADHDDLLRHRADDRAEGLRRRDPRRHGELSAGRARRSRHRAARIVLVVLGERAQGKHRLHGHHPGARLALAHVAPSRRGRRGMMRARWPLVAFVLAIAAAPWIVPPFYVTLLNYIGLAGLVVLGLVLLTGIAGIVSFGQQAFVGIAAYTTALLTTAMGLSPWVSLFASLAVVGAFGLLLGAITLRLSGHYLAIATIAWGIALYYVFGNLPGLGQYSGIDDLPPIALFGWPLDTAPRIYYLIWTITILALAAAMNLLDSRSGRALRALRFRGVMAESFGVDTARLKVL